MGDPISIPPVGRSVELDPREMRTSRLQSSPAPEGKTFKEVLQESVGEVQRLQTEADLTIKQLVAGELEDVTEAMVAVEKADVSFRTMMVVRNRMVAAYEEIMRMQV